jgi:hypothetical protein
MAASVWCAQLLLPVPDHQSGIRKPAYENLHTKTCIRKPAYERLKSVYENLHTKPCLRNLHTTTCIRQPAYDKLYMETCIRKHAYENMHTIIFIRKPAYENLHTKTCIRKPSCLADQKSASRVWCTLLNDANGWTFSARCRVNRSFLEMRLRSCDWRNAKKGKRAKPESARTLFECRTQSRSQAGERNTTKMNRYSLWTKRLKSTEYSPPQSTEYKPPIRPLCVK